MKKVNFNPELYRFDPQTQSKWRIFEQPAIVIVTQNNLAELKRLIHSLFLRIHLPCTISIFDQASTDGTADYLAELRQAKKNIVVEQLPQAMALDEVYEQVKRAVQGDLIICFDPQAELLSSYWLLHLLKAYYAYALNRNSTEIVLGIRTTHAEEYGARYADQVESFMISSAQNSPPRTSYSVKCKDQTDAAELLDERVIISYSPVLVTGGWVMPMTLFQAIDWQNATPGFRQGFAMPVLKGHTEQIAAGYIENGPLLSYPDQQMISATTAKYPRRPRREKASEDAGGTYDAPPKWMLFRDIVIMIVTFNRLQYTQKLIDSLYRYTHLPFTLHIFDQASTDGTADYLNELERTKTNVVITRFKKNIGLGRAYLAAKKKVQGDLLVCFDNDIELFSDDWLTHLLKGYYAYYLQTHSLDVAIGLRLFNLEEYGGRFSQNLVEYRIPTAQNDPPRTSYSMFPSNAAPTHFLDERVLMGQVYYLGGGLWSISVPNFRRIQWENHYPVYIRGVANFSSEECNRLGITMGYLENGPIARHNGWPYDEDQIQTYDQLVFKRAVTDVHYFKWKIRDVLRRFIRFVV